MYLNMDIIKREGRNSMTVTYSICGKQLTEKDIASISLHDNAISMACNAVRKRNRRSRGA